MTENINPRQAGAPQHPGPGVFEHPPSNSAPDARIEEKSVRKLVKKHFESTSVIFSLRSKLRSPEVTKAKQKSIFRAYGTCLQINAIISETKIAKTNLKSTGNLMKFPIANASSDLT